MKKTRFFLLVVCFLLIFPTLARAEWFLDFYGGKANTQDVMIDAEISYASFLGSSFDSHSENVSFDSSFIMGGRIGYWFEGLPWVGISTDLSYFQAKGDKAKFDIVPASLLLMLRWPLFKSEKFPHGRIQPYAAIGPSLYCYYARVDFRPDLPEKISGYDGGMGIDIRAGLSWQVHRHWAIFGEYRYTDTEVKLENTDLFYGFAGNKETMKTHLNTNNFLVGISYRF